MSERHPPHPRVARWDLDKTYLRTEFDTLRDLVRTALERPDEKRSVPGASAVLRELAGAGARIHILSGSPRQMRSALSRKLALDGVRFDQLTLKPNLQNLLRLRFRSVRDQLGYKLPALLEAHLEEQRGRESGVAEEVLVGDDAEADAFVYALYGDLLLGRIRTDELHRVLRAGQLYEDQVERILALSTALPQAAAAPPILIHLDRQSPPSRFDGYGARVVPFYNYFQAAVALLEWGWLGADAVLRVGGEFMVRHRFDPDALARSWLDLVRRGHSRASALPLVEAAAEQAGDGDEAEGMRQVARRTREALADVAPRQLAENPTVDYTALAERHRGGRNRPALRPR